MNFKEIKIINLSFFLIFIFAILNLFYFISAQQDSFEISESDTSLLKAFDNASFANNLMKQDNFIGLEIRDDQILARVMVILKDNSGIEIIGTKEERADLINQKISWVEKQTEEVLKDYSDNGLILRGKTSGGFGAFITKETFNKLVNDTRVQEISWTDSKPSSILAESAILINANDVWSLGYSGKGVKVCIIDTGIDTSSPYLNETIADEKCYNSDNGCPDGTSEDDSAYDDYGHGTEVAGIIASQSLTYRGISPNVSLYVVRATDFDGQYSNDWDIDVGNSIDWCRNQNVNIISMSFANGPWLNTTCPSDINTQINNAYNAGIILVAGSGNDAKEDKIGYPACNNNVLSVGASYDVGNGTQEVDWCEATGGTRILGICFGSTFDCKDSPLYDNIACWGNRNSNLDLLAPGFSIITTALGGDFNYGLVGTSLSAPMVTGAAALLLEKNPSLETDEIRSLFKSTGKSIYDNETGLTFKRIDVENAIKSFDFKIETTSTNQTFSFRTDNALNLNVFWGDGDYDVYNGTGLRSHVYENTGNHTIFLKGQASRISFYEGTPTLLKDILTRVSDGITGITSAHNMFRDATGITSFTAGDFFDKISENVTDMSHMFHGATDFNQNLNNWNTSSVTNMEAMFDSAINFNGNISNWDTYSVTDMFGMFYGATNFNQNIGNWDVSNVGDMWSMFAYATNFNQPLDNWNTSSVVYIVDMFAYATSFNGNISNWDVSGVTAMSQMFNHAIDFNQPLDNWNTSSVIDMYGMFYVAIGFNQNLNNWDTSSATNMEAMFYSATNFNQPLDNWDTFSVTDMGWMFYAASSFNQNLNNWDTSSATNMEAMFTSASNFNGNISNWDTSHVTTMGWMFMYATNFNQPIGNWDTSSVISTGDMFAYATNFNQPIGNWDTSSVIDTAEMFYAAPNFNQNIGNWDVSGVTTMSQMFGGGAGLSTENYDSLLIGWNSLPSLQNGVIFEGGNSKYSLNANSSRQNLINYYSWTITDGGLVDTPPVVNLTSPANNSIDTDGSVIFNCSATDDKNLVNITLYGNWSGNWNANETKSLTGKSNFTTFTKSLPNGFYKWNCRVFDNSSQFDWADANRTIKINITVIAPPNDTYKFYHKNSANENIAWLGNQGNIILKGKCYSGGNCNNPGTNSIIFGNSTDNYVAFINSTGDLCLEKGDCSDESLNCNSPSDGSFIIRNSTNNNVIYIDKYGDLCMIGKLYENSQP